MGGFAGPGLGPLRFSADDHSGYGGLQIGKVQGGKSVLSGPVFTTDDGSGEVKESELSQEAPPDKGIPN